VGKDDEYPITNGQLPISKFEVGFGNWKLEVGHWLLIMVVEVGEIKDKINLRN
jgi:hypothetical protein